MRARFLTILDGGRLSSTHVLSTVGEQLADRYARVFLPHIHRLEHLRLSAPCDEDAQAILDIELDPEEKSGSLRATCLKVNRDAETVHQLGPTLLGTYTVEMHPQPDGSQRLTLTLTSDSPLLTAQVKLDQLETRDGDLAAQAAAGRSNLGLSITFRPSPLGRLLGLKTLAMVRPLTCTLDHGEVDEIIELEEREFTSLIERHAECFADKASFKIARELSSRSGSYRGELRYRPADDNGEPLAERWILPAGEFEAQTVFTVRRGSADRYPSFRIIGLSRTHIDIIDAPVILYSSADLKTPSRPISWEQLAATQEVPPECTRIIAGSLTISGVRRRIEITPTGINLSAAILAELESFIEGVTTAERAGHIPAGSLVIRLVPAQFHGATSPGDGSEPPLGTVTWSPGTEVAPINIAEGRPTLDDTSRRAGFWAGRHAIALAIAHTRGAELLDEVLKGRSDDVRIDLERLLDTARRLGAPAPYTLQRRTDLVLLALAIEETPSLAVPVAALPLPAGDTVSRMRRIVAALQDGDL